MYSSLIGKIIGDLKILKYVGCVDEKSKNYYFEVECAVCGRVYIKRRQAVISNEGMSHVNCINYVDKPQPYYKHFNMKFNALRQRCLNPNNSNYKNYGGRGIKCNYENVIDFYNDHWDNYLQHCVTHGISETTIERIDTNGDYVKENITWATHVEQNQNVRKMKMFKAISPDGEVTIHNNQNEFSRTMGWNSGRISGVLGGSKKSYKGWIFEYI